MRIDDKIHELKIYLAELLQICPESFREYRKDFKTRAACERYLEKIIEATVDLTFLIIKERNLRVPENDKQAFDIIASEEIITEELATKLKDAKGMRNILAHQYSNIDNKIVFQTIKEDLIDDVDKFIEEIITL